MKQIDENDKVRLSKSLTILASSVGAELLIERMKVYCDLLLQDYSIEQLEQACYEFSRDLGRKFFPTVPEFHEKLLGNPESNATKAIAVLEKAMRERGANECVMFEDAALTNAIVYADGWITVCRVYPRMEAQEFGYWQHRFRQTYVESAKDRRAPLVKYFEGLFAISNSASIGTWERGRLAEPKVHVFAIDGAMTTVPLASIEPKAALVEAYQKLLTGDSDTVEPV